MVISTISGPTTSDPTGFLPIELRPHGILSYLFPPLLPCFHLPFSPFIIPCPERDPGIAYICSAYPSLLLSPFLASSLSSSLSLHSILSSPPSRYSPPPSPPPSYFTPFCPLLPLVAHHLLHSILSSPHPTSLVPHISGSKSNRGAA